MALYRYGMLPHSPHIIFQTLRQPCGKIHPDRRGLLLLLHASDMVSRKMKCLADREGRCVVSSWCLPPYQFSHVSKNDWLTWLYWELFQSIWNAFTLCIWHFFKKSYFFPQNLLVSVKGGPSPCFLQLDPVPLFLLMPPTWKATGEGRWQDHCRRCWEGETITTLNCYFVKHHVKYFKTCLIPDALWREQQHGRRPSKCHTLSRSSQMNGKGSSALTMS